MLFQHATTASSFHFLLSSPKQHVKCLYVHLSENATFCHHIEETTKKARRMAGWILRVFHSRKADCLLPVWKTLVVQPIQDHCSQVWSAQKKGDIQSLEAVQREFTRCIQETIDLSYWEHLQHLGLHSQQRRKERYICMYIWKILKKQVPDPTNNTILS